MREKIRFKRLRILLGHLHSMARGWYFRYASREKSALDAGWHCLSEVATKIRWRDELLEINRHRIDNMALAAAMVDGIRLRPGEIFSLQHIIGEPGEKQGFKKGPMIIRGRLGFTYGGGLCQVSTTLFNAALKADLEILQKYNHSIDLWGEERFVDLGLDATYVFARRDLKFRNTHGADIMVKASVSEKDLLFTCSIFSSLPLPRPVRIERRILQETEPPVPEPTGRYRAVSGWTVLTTRYSGDGPDQIISYRKLETYKASLIRKEDAGCQTR